MLVWTLGCMYLFKLECSSFLDIYPGVGLLDHMVALFLVFFRNLHTVFHGGYTNLHSYLQCSLFSTPSPAFIICKLFDGSHSDWCEVTPNCGFDFYFLIISDVENPFICLLAICMYSLEKCVCRSYFGILKHFLRCVETLYTCFIFSARYITIHLCNLYNIWYSYIVSTDK